MLMAQGPDQYAGPWYVDETGTAKRTIVQNATYLSRRPCTASFTYQHVAMAPERDALLRCTATLLGMHRHAVAQDSLKI